MAISLSVAIAFSPNYIVYTILRYTLYYEQALRSSCELLKLFRNGSKRKLNVVYILKECLICN